MRHSYYLTSVIKTNFQEEDVEFIVQARQFSIYGGDQIQG